MANTPTARGLRLSGQVELATVDAPPDWRRVDVLMEHAKGTYSGLAGSPAQKMERWMGHRPSTPDGLPVIGPSSRFPDVIYAFGQGHVGFASGPVTGRIVADQISGRATNINIGVFSPRRFRWKGQTS
ncbi:NAD(P)/FAD-dependent oxidoreductase [Pararhizobium sp. LjRoot238]|uniref:NAD(P)/FAD-dependent oxidoreductase n=1 Tax=Pararhizobium sp. LjRoot238 TaxID=3342293 RepID=UPI003F4F8E3F